MTDNEMIDLITLDDMPQPYDSMARLIGIEATKQIIKEFGGEQLHLSKLESVIRNTKRRKILEELKGYNIKELAQKYKCSVRWVYELNKNKDCYEPS